MTCFKKYMCLCLVFFAPFGLIVAESKNQKDHGKTLFSSRHSGAKRQVKQGAETQLSDQDVVKVKTAISRLFSSLTDQPPRIPFENILADPFTVVARYGAYKIPKNSDKARDFMPSLEVDLRKLIGEGLILNTGTYWASDVNQARVIMNTESGVLYGFIDLTNWVFTVISKSSSTTPYTTHKAEILLK